MAFGGRSGGNMGGGRQFTDRRGGFVSPDAYGGRYGGINPGGQMPPNMTNFPTDQLPNGPVGQIPGPTDAYADLANAYGGRYGNAPPQGIPPQADKRYGGINPGGQKFPPFNRPMPTGPVSPWRGRGPQFPPDDWRGRGQFPPGSPYGGQYGGINPGGGSRRRFPPSSPYGKSYDRINPPGGGYGGGNRPMPVDPGFSPMPTDRMPPGGLKGGDGRRYGQAGYGQIGGPGNGMRLL